MWKNNVEPVWPQMTIWRMRIARLIPKATNTHSECVILIAFPLQQRLNERAPKLRSTHVACLVAFDQQRLHHTRRLGNYRRASQASSCCRKIFRAAAFLLERKPCNNHEGMNRHFRSRRERLAICDWWSPLRVLLFKDKRLCQHGRAA